MVHNYIKGLKCRECGREYELNPVNICEYCFGPLEVNYNYNLIRDDLGRNELRNGPNTLWRYKKLLPVSGERIIDIGAGFTPLIKAENLGREFGIKELYLKNDSVNPTFSFKDRVVSVAISKAIEFGFDTVACPSTGNLANSVAAHAAKAGLKCYIFIPSDLESGKIINTQIYNPNLVMVDGNYDDINRLCSEIADNYKWAFVNINIRPYYSEGSKTLGYEVAEQLNWETPDRVVVPVASGSLLTKIYKGFSEFQNLGLIDEFNTKFTAAQAKGCSPVVDAFSKGVDTIKPVRPNTIAKSLAIGNPADGYYAINVLQKTKGSAGAVTDEEIIEGIKLLARTEGIFTEPAGGVVVGTLKKLVEEGNIQKDERTVIYITGNGLKTQEVVANHLTEPYRIKPTMNSFKENVMGMPKVKISSIEF